LDKLKTTGVDLSQVTNSQKSSTAVTLVAANDSGERCFLHHFGANTDLKLDDIDFKHLSKSKAVLLCSYFIMPGLDGEPSKTILQRAKRDGLTTFFDVAWDPSGKWDLGDILEFVDVFIPNDDELRMLTKEKDIKSAVNILLDSGVPTVAVKKGNKGCYVANSEGEKIELAAEPVSAIDTTGAGDTFNAAFVYGVLSSWNLEKTAKFANVAGAISVTKVGGATAAPTRQEIENFIKTSDIK
jgi:sugar/nucleoside kinase (ribokinase family)